MKKSLLKLDFILFYIILTIFLSDLSLLKAQDNAADANNNVYQCGIITSPGVYKLTNDLYSPGNCIQIYSNNVILDGNGFSIKPSDMSPGSLAGNGVSAEWVRNITIKNFKSIEFKSNGVFLSNVLDSRVENSTIINNGYLGFYVSSCKNNIFDGLILRGNSYFGIYLDSSSGNLVNNTLSELNGDGVGIQNGFNNILNNVSTFFNPGGIVVNSGSANVITNSVFFNLQQNLIESDSFNENSERSYALGEQDFAFNINYPDGTACTDFDYNISIYPGVDYTSNKEDNILNLNLNLDKQGVYTIKLDVRTNNNNREIKNFIFLAGNTSQGSVRYYMHADEPSHGQPLAIFGYDSGSMFNYPVDKLEERNCSYWIQYQPDEINNFYPVIRTIDLGIFYKATGEVIAGIQRYSKYEANMDYSMPIGSSPTHTFAIISFNGLNLVSDYPWMLYWLGLKLQGNSPSIISSKEQQSYADLTYVYSGPKIEMFKEEPGSDLRDIAFLSSVFNDENEKNASFQFEGNGRVNLVLNMTPGDYDVFYNDIKCNLNSECIINYNLDGIINLSLSISGLNRLDVYEKPAPIIMSIISPYLGEIVNSSNVFFSVRLNKKGTCFYLKNNQLFAMASLDGRVFSKSAEFTDGAYKAVFYCNDSSGFNNTKDIDFYIDTSTQGEFVWDFSDVLGEEDLLNGYSNLLGKGHRFNFMINNQVRNLGVINLNPSKVYIRLFPGFGDDSLVIGEIKKYSFTNPDYYDLYIKLNSISNNKANITIKEIHESSNPKIIYVNECQTLTIRNKVYMLNKSLFGNQVTPNCISLFAGNITFDCNYNTIIPRTILPMVLIYNNWQNDNIIKNCNLNTGGIAISSYGNRNQFLNNYINSVSQYGVRVQGNDNLINNNYFKNSGKAIAVEYGDRNVVKNNLAKDSRWGFSVWGGQYNQVINNKAYNNQYGIVLYQANDSLLKCNNFSKNSYYDLYAYGVPWYYPVGKETNKNITSVNNIYFKKYIGKGAELKILYGECSNECIWNRDTCVSNI
ncbi:MAG: right-handed parallel beta-helix repeat-containing protein [Candidatus Nanoarchaeia archaeon]